VYYSLVPEVSLTSPNQISVNAAVEYACALSHPYFRTSEIKTSRTCTDKGSQIISTAACSGFMQTQLLNKRYGEMEIGIVESAAAVRLRFSGGTEILARGIVVAHLHREDWKYGAEFTPYSSGEIAVQVKNNSRLRFAEPLSAGLAVLEKEKVWLHSYFDEHTYCDYAKLRGLAAGLLLGPNFIAVKARDPLAAGLRICIADVGDQLSEASRSLTPSARLCEIHDLIWNTAEALALAVPEPLSSLCVLARRMGLEAYRLDPKLAVVSSSSPSINPEVPLALVIRSEGGVTTCPRVISGFLHHDSDEKELLPNLKKKSLAWSSLAGPEGFWSRPSKEPAAATCSPSGAQPAPREKVLTPKTSKVSL
jgi:hypothetical protein